MIELDIYMKWEIVHAALCGIIIIPLFIVWVVTFCTARKRGDPARSGFTWMKAVFFLELIAIIFLVVWDALYVVYRGYYVDRFSDYYSDDFDIIGLEKALTKIGPIYSLFERLADAVMIIALVEVGTGFLYAISRTKSSLKTVLLLASVAVAVILTALNFAVFGRGLYLRNEYDEDNLTSREYRWELWVIRRVSFTFNVLDWVVSLALVGLGVMVVIKSKAMPMLRSSAVIFLVATILWFIRTLLTMVYTALYALPSTVDEVPHCWLVVDGIFNVWFFFVALVLLYVIDVRKGQKGVWTAKGQQPAQVTGYGYGQSNGY